MTASKHYALTAAVVAALTASPALAGGNVMQNRTYPLATGVASQIHVNLATSDPQTPLSITGAPVDWITEVELVIKARAAGAAEAEAIADGIWTAVYARICADQSLGGRVQDFQPGPAYFDSDEADTSVAKVTWRFKVQHRTTSNTIS